MNKIISSRTKCSLQHFHPKYKQFYNKIRFSFANKTPFNQQKSSSPFITPPTNNSWHNPKPTTPTPTQPLNATPSSSSTLNDTKKIETQKMTPLSTSPQQKIVQTQIKVDFQPPPLNFGNDLKTILKQQTTSNEIPHENNPPQQTTQQEVMSNLGLNLYLTRIFTTTGISISITLASAYLGMFIPNISELSEVMAIANGVLSYALLQKANQMPPTFIRQQRHGQNILKTKNSAARLLTFGFGCVSLGLASSPLFYSINQISMFALPLTMGITSAVFGGAALVGLLLPRNFMAGYGSVLTGGLFGLIGLNLTGLLAAKYLGMAAAATIMTTTQSYIGIGIFSFLIIYDTHMAINRYKAGNADHLGMSTQILLDIWNIIIRVAAEIAKAQAKNKKK